MKLSLLSLITFAIIVTLPACTTETTTHPDGSVTVTKRVDSAAVAAGGSVVQKVVPIFYQPRRAVTSAKDVAVVEAEPVKEPSWLELGMSLLGL